MKVAIGLHFLSLESGIRITAAMFGVSLNMAWKSTMQFIDVINYDTGDFISLRTDFDNISREFEDIAGFPDVFAAVDGTHILLNRPENFVGIYTRKGVPSLNVQAIVVATTRFMNLSVRYGSCNDKRLWSDSQFGANVADLIPSYMHVLGDSIYMLRTYLMTPFDNETTDP